MIRKSLILFIAAIAVLGLTAMAFSAGKGNDRKGKYTFRKSCRTCHIDGGSAEALSPDSKTMKQWQRLFEKGKYKKLDCKAEWDKLSEDQLADIYAYLYKHAYDSPTPAKCK
jgi:mono/diheme cytochrome c family protein